MMSPFWHFIVGRYVELYHELQKQIHKRHHFRKFSKWFWAPDWPANQINAHSSYFENPPDKNECSWIVGMHCYPFIRGRRCSLSGLLWSPIDHFIPVNASVKINSHSSSSPIDTWITFMSVILDSLATSYCITRWSFCDTPAFSENLISVVQSQFD